MKNRIIKVLSQEHMLRFNNWLDNEDGHLNPVFIAEFNHPDAGGIMAFCKLYNPSGKGLINEIIGFLFGRAFQIPQPDHAFLTILPRTALPELAKIAKRKDNKWLNLKNAPAELIMFCTSRLDGESAALHFHADNEITATLANEVWQWKEYPAAIALDENIAHTDRHLNNLLRLGSKRYAVIDNGILISEISGNWNGNMLKKDKLFTNRLYDDVSCHKTHKKPHQNNIFGRSILCAEAHTRQLKEVVPELEFWLNQYLPPEEKTQLQDFLNHRTKEVPWLLKKRFGIRI